VTTETGPTPAAWDRDSLPQGEEKVAAEPVATGEPVQPEVV